MRGTSRRVVESRRIACAALRLGGLFAGVSLIWSAWVLIQGGSWWGPVHAFLAGTVLLAISGTTQTFTITGAAAAPPSAGASSGQRWLLGVGVGLVLIGVASGTAVVVVAGGLLMVLSLGLLGAILLGAIRRSLLRRFDLSSRFYLLAIGAGVIGVTLGGVLGSGVAAGSYEEIRTAHVHLNLVGLVGLTIVGTLPTILPTFAHRRAVSGQEARIAWWLAVASVALMTSGLAIGRPAVGVGALLAGASLAMILVGVVGRLGRNGLEAGLPYLQVCLGSGWLLLWVIIDGLALLRGDGPFRFSGWNAAVIVAGVGQVLLGSLAYLLPVLAGGRPHLAHNLERAAKRPWLPLVAANVAGAGFAAGLELLAGVALIAWLADFGWRLTRFEWRDSDERGSVSTSAS